MPNFSHGTAGVAYFLARMYQATGEEKFLHGALAGGAYLRSVAAEDGLIFHHEPGGENLFYLGWCHGPAGTGRLYSLLWKITQDSFWYNDLVESAEGIIKSGIPDNFAPGFWNNVGQCCGSAGISEFFLGLHSLFGNKKYLDFAKHIMDDVLERYTVDGEGIKWIQAEHRVKPDLLIAQTGYMQGAAGVGMSLIHYHLMMTEGFLGTQLPDSPF
jgi:lantibiotic modifying enzyme